VNTSVIPVRLDNTEIPVLLRTKRYVDLRNRSDRSEVAQLARQITDGSVRTAANRVPKDRSYHCSLLSMVIGGIVKDFPAAGMTDEEIAQGESLIDLYRTVDTLITRFQDIVNALLADELWKNNYQAQVQKLRDIGCEMQTLVSAFDGVLSRDSALRTRLNRVFQLCVQIGGCDSAIIVSLGGEDYYAHYVTDEQYEDHTSHGGYIETQYRVSEYQKLLADLSQYRHDLRDAIARLTASAS